MYTPIVIGTSTIVMTLALFTSLPPSMNRINADGKNIGREHYRACLQSWCDHGFQIVSINSADEAKSDIEVEFHIQRLEAQRDARLLCGKPLVYFSDFMSLIYDHADGPIAIINADIEMDFTADDLNRISTLQRGTFICERRRDYQNGDKGKSTPYSGGFDFFALHRDDLPLMFNTELVFGMPWWDHYFPVALLARNFQHIHLGRQSSIYHLDHDERWDMKRFFHFGYVFRSEIDKIASTGQISQGFATMKTRYEKIEQDIPHFPFPRRVNFFRNLFDFTPEDPTHNYMLWIAHGSLRLIEKPNDRPMAQFNPLRFFERLPL